MFHLKISSPCRPCIFGLNKRVMICPAIRKDLKRDQCLFYNTDTMLLQKKPSKIGG